MIRNVIYFLYGLIVLMLVRMVMRWVGRTFGEMTEGRSGNEKPRASSRRAEDLVRDPICNTYVPRSRALTATVGGHQEHFCSEGCRDKARAAVPRAS